MKNLILFLGLTMSFAAHADSASAQIEKEQFKAVADAVVEKHRIAEDESLRAIINLPGTSGGRTFVIQYVDQKGNCLQESVDVYKMSVNFNRQPRQQCN